MTTSSLVVNYISKSCCRHYRDSTRTTGLQAWIYPPRNDRPSSLNTRCYHLLERKWRHLLSSRNSWAGSVTDGAADDAGTALNGQAMSIAGQEVGKTADSSDEFCDIVRSVRGGCNKLQPAIRQNLLREYGKWKRKVKISPLQTVEAYMRVSCEERISSTYKKVKLSTLKGRGNIYVDFLWSTNIIYI
jgi:hypothetical protein